jgi:hypothetical protein
VITSDAQLLRFDPRTVAFSLVGSLDCPITVDSMAIDRSGSIWLHGSDGRFARTDVRGSHCSELASKAPLAFGFERFGMGFAADTAGSTEETLYVAGVFGLGKFDTAALAITKVGDFGHGIHGPAELAGNAQGDLFALFPQQSKLSLSPLDRHTGEAVSGIAADLGGFSAWAVAYFGGDLWLFTDQNVHRLNRASGKLELLAERTGWTVVGAGTSTCAPTE